MIDIKDINYVPSIDEISDSIGLALFDKFCQYMESEYKAIRKIEFSKDVWARGWNLKFRKAGFCNFIIWYTRITEAMNGYPEYMPAFRKTVFKSCL